MPILTKPKPDEYGPLERDEALACYALCSGHPHMLRAMLAEKEIGVPVKTIQSWATGSHRERYAQIREEVQFHRDIQLADKIKANTIAAAEVVDKATSQLSQKLDSENLDAKDLSSIGKNSSVILGIHVQRGAELEGKPNVRVSHDLPGMLKEAKQLGLEVIEGTAEEIPDAELVEET